MTTATIDRPRTGRGARLAKAALALAGAAALTCGTSAAADTSQGSNPPGVHLLNPEMKKTDTTPCPAGWLCLYGGFDYSYGAIAVLPGSQVENIERIRFTNGGSFTGGDGVSSWVNNSPVRYCWYESTGFQGSSHEFAAFGKEDHIKPNDALKSFKPC
ncbi:peptidase inhibitor family I36 protein [Kitasatospora aureofaciens]|uniref:peptidase inhibitor family I36 protein n=1 Tax=Kitasatospora aureofaciens TaxID=1894 RepID=UPI001C44DC10|nr:peptidase inhibitor family I36 protein [Kitasatospora aureofaciens]MBV6696769.1 peptidase inhibitor family I36 protein [Kitasatospora aureofaciens]